MGVGFYAASILLAVLAAGALMWGARIEGWLPSHPAVGLTLKFDPGTTPDAETLDRFVRKLGCSVARGALQGRPGLAPPSVICRLVKLCELRPRSTRTGPQVWRTGADCYQGEA